ncbi:tetratricopeptide repeat-containing sensor histidine kinase [Hugenholtzia roseola]|uniref:tetratricopeptide repeat-containing sensor histidine kinase n=1 Tax=Hugenholtzia roseola TaxID=1002 RepID=UPI0013771AB2|nr:ATP-binding protein [Hugenholtzia roseola]
MLYGQPSGQTQIDKTEATLLDTLSLIWNSSHPSYKSDSLKYKKSLFFLEKNNIIYSTKVVEFAQKTLYVAEKIGTQDEQERLTLILAQIYIQNNEPYRALRILQEFRIHHYSSEKKELSKGIALWLARAYKEVLQPRRAIENYGVFLHQSTEQDSLYPIVCQEIALLYRQINKPIDATIHLKNALYAVKRQKLEKEVVKIFTEIGRLKIDQQKYDSALFYYLEAEKQSLNLPHKPFLAAIRKEIAQTYFALEEMQAAESYVQQALASNEQEAILKGELWLLLAQILHKEKNTAQAFLYKEKAVEEAEKHHNLRLLLRSIELELALWEAEGEKDKEVETYKKYVFLKDSLHKIETSYQKLGLEQAFEYEQNQQNLAKENETQRLQNEKQAEELLQAAHTRNLLLLLTAFFIIIGVFWYNRYRHDKKAQFILKKKNDQIRSNYEQVKRLNEKLADSEATLARLNETKDKFFSIIAHDLKSPLNSLKGFSHLLTTFGAQLSTEEIQKIAHDQQKTIEHLYNFLDNLLTWSRSQMSVLEFKPQLLYLKQEVEDVLLLLKKNIEDKALHIELDIEEDRTVLIDKNALSTILRNLISNAIKFSFTASSIKIYAQAEGARVHVFISDQGVGMPASVAEKLFSLGNKHSTKGTAGEKGTGLGLVIVKDFVEQNQGEISLESIENQGTTFKISFPASDTPQNN